MTRRGKHGHRARGKQIAAAAPPAAHEHEGACPAHQEAATGSDLIGVLVIMIVAIVLRALVLNQPMRYDEAYTELNFVSRDFWYGISHYNVPNNHVLNTVFAHASTLLFGQAPWAVRIPAFLCGIATVYLTLRVGLRLTNRSAAFAAAGLMAVSTTEILYSTNARGYTMVDAFWLIAVLAGTRLRRGDVAFRTTAILGLALALSLFANPSALFAVPGLLLWSFWPQRARGRAALVRGAAVTLATLGIGTGLLYLPAVVTSGWASVVHNRFYAPRGLAETVFHLPDFLVGVGADWTAGIPVAAVVVLGIALGRGLLRFRSPLASLFWMSLVGATGVTLAMRRIPIGFGIYSRVWLFLLPIAALVACEGLQLLWADLHRVGALRWQPSATWTMVGWAGLVFVVGAVPLRDQNVLRRRDTGALRSAESILHDLDQTPTSAHTMVLARSPSILILLYYSLLNDRDSVYAHHFSVPPGGTSDAWLIVNTGEAQSLDDLKASAVEHGFCVDSTRLERTYVDAELWHADAVPCATPATGPPRP